MFTRILKSLQGLIKARAYVMTLHAEEEMNADDLTIYDIEHGILTGEIKERQKDRETGEWKYRVEGDPIFGDKIEIIVKIGVTGRLVIITVYRP